MNIYTLPSNSVQLLSELVDAENPSKYLYNKYKNANSKEQDILRGIIKELRENGFIDVIWADNCPVRVILNNSARTYNEQLAEYERQTQAFQNRGSENTIQQATEISSLLLVVRNTKNGKMTFIFLLRDTLNHIHFMMIL